MHCTTRLAFSAEGRRLEPTIFPHTKSNTNDLPLVSGMVHNGPHRNAHDRQRWYILWLRLVRLRERTDILGSRNSRLDLTPGYLGSLHKRGIAGAILH